MTLFSLVVGLEARREFDLGDMGDRRRFVLPCAVGIVRKLIPVLIYLAINHDDRERTLGASRCRPTPCSLSAC